MATIGSLVVDMRANTAQLDAQLKHAKSNFGSLQKTISHVRDALVAFGAVKVLSDVLKAAADSQKAFAVLTSQVKATGGAAGYGTEQLAAMAMQMERTTTFSHEEIENAQSELLAFTNITGEQFKKTMQVSMDFATVTGRNLPDAIRTLGEAINNPVQDMGRLTQAGISLTKQQENLIRTMASSGNMMGAQNAMLKDLETSYGGAAAAARDTIGGALEGLKNQFDDLIEGNDGSFNGAVEAINQLTTTLDSPEVKEGFASLISGIAQAVSWAAKAVDAFAKMGQGIGILAAKMGGFGGQETPGLAALDAEIKSIKSDISSLEMEKGQPAYQTNLGQNYLQQKIDHDKLILKNYMASRKAVMAHGFNYGIPHTNSTAAKPTLGPLAALNDPFGALIPPKNAYEKSVQDFESAFKQVQGIEKQIQQMNAENSQVKDRHQIQGAQEAMSALDSLAKKTPQYIAQVASDIQQMVGHTVNDITVTPKMAQEAIKQLNNKNKDAVNEAAQYGIEAARNIQDAFAQLFLHLNGGWRSIMQNMLKSFEEMAAQVAAKDLLGKVLGTDSGKSGGNLTGLASVVASWFGGKKAGGGGVSGGTAYLVGEKGPEMFVPHSSGSIVPNDRLGAPSVQHTVNIDARGAGPDEVAKLSAMRRDIITTMRSETEFRLTRGNWRTNHAGA